MARRIQALILVLIALAGAYYLAIRLGWLEVPAFLIKDEEGKLARQAITAYRDGDYQYAVQAYERYLEVEPGDPDAWYGLALSLGRLERLDEALAAARRAVSLDPGDRKKQAALGLLHLGRGEYREAIDVYDRLLQEDYHDQGALANRAFAYYRWGREEEALQEYRAAVKEFPASPQLRYSLGTLLYDRGDYAAALPEFRQATHLNLRYEEAYLMMARCELRLGRRQEAGEHARQALRLASPEKDGLRKEAGELLKELGAK